MAEFYSQRRQIVKVWVEFGSLGCILNKRLGFHIRKEYSNVFNLKAMGVVSSKEMREKRCEGSTISNDSLIRTLWNNDIIFYSFIIKFCPILSDEIF